MKVDYFNPFLRSTISVFQSMLGVKLSRATPFLKQGSEPEHEVSGMIGLSGNAQGMVVLGLGREAAIEATTILLQQRPTDLDGDVTDAVGELVNIIAGGAKADLAELGLSLGLPTVITGRSHRIEFPREVPPICIPFDSEWGLITVEVGLALSPVHA